MLNIFGGKDKIFSKDEALDQVKMAKFKNPQIEPLNTIIDNHIILAYSQAKMSLDNEMDKYYRYSKMDLCEYFEYLARLAQLMFKEGYDSLPDKITELLQILLPMVGQSFIPPGEVEIESESDYDDDFVNDMLEEVVGGKY
jgi:hypothetical protein